MWWIIIIAVVIYIIYKYTSDRNKLLTGIESRGGLQRKYRELISCILAESPGARIVNVTRDTIVINWNLGQFIIFQLFDKVRITWKMNLPTGVIQDSLEFPVSLDQQLMAKRIENSIDRRSEEINWTSEFEVINDQIKQEIYPFSSEQYNSGIDKKLENTIKANKKIIKPGKEYDGIVLNETTFKDVVRKYGNEFDIQYYDSSSYDSKAFSMVYKNLGMAFIFEEDDPERHIRSIELFKESNVMTEYGIDFNRNNSAVNVLNFHGTLRKDKITEVDEFLCLDYGEILFYFYKGGYQEFEDLKLTKIRLVKSDYPLAEID
jgi:hypothetical protein